MSRSTRPTPDARPWRIAVGGEWSYASICPRCSRRRGWAQHPSVVRAITEAIAEGFSAYERASAGQYTPGADDDTCACS